MVTKCIQNVGLAIKLSSKLNDKCEIFAYQMSNCFPEVIYRKHTIINI